MLQVRIGIGELPKEIEVEVELAPDDLSKRVEKAIASETSMLWLEDTKGMRVGVPAGKISYVQFESGTDKRPVGFGP